MKNLLTIFIFFLYAFSGLAQKTLLQSGPMVGYSEMKEVMLWVQTNTEAEVHFEYTPQENPGSKFKTVVVETEKAKGFTAKIIADQVQPGQIYDYSLFINGQKVSLPYKTTFQSQTLWQYRTDPPNFKIALGSCVYINEPATDRPSSPYGGEYKIFSSIADQDPDMMLWLGDNTYFREADWNSWTGIIHRHTHSRSVPEMQKLLGTTHNYAIWDDHDYGPNDSDRSYVHKDWTREAFDYFWGNPEAKIGNLESITTMFQFNDLDFFLLDNRYYRSPNRRKTGDKTILGKEQLEWLIDALVASRAPFKMVCIGGQVLNTAAVYENYAANHAEERRYLLKRIEEEDIKGVVFLTGDRHHSELSSRTNLAGNTIYDFTVSPLTSGSGRGNEEEGNKHKVEGTFVNQRNFGIIEVSGSRLERVLILRTMDVDGNEIWAQKISAVDIYKEK